ncbi:MAG: outer membrane protein [Bacteroidetes bacterium]|nr:MAG: outer membrane protein [Bacteroidota bacterium]
MKKNIFLLLLFVSVASFAQDTKRCAGAEPIYISRMPGFYISDCRNSDYNEVEFVYWLDGDANKLTKGGKYYKIFYSKNENETKQFSSAQINLNYANAILKAKGTTYDKGRSFFSASFDGKQVYIQVNTASNSSDARSYNVEIIEVDAMQQEVTVNLQESIDKDGKIALYEILFDLGKAEIKPESSEALTQIVDYLTANPDVKVVVVGHTDNTGTYEGNITLSKARAESVRNYLITNGKIQQNRLKAEGAGQFCPVTTNSTEEGRKLNRRVEVVKL